MSANVCFQGDFGQGDFGRWLRAVRPGARRSAGSAPCRDGLITVTGARIWVDNKVDFSNSCNLLVAAITLVLGTGDFTLKFGGFALGGIGTATFGAILLHAVLSRGRR
jgi:hypothetical protein